MKDNIKKLIIAIIFSYIIVTIYIATNENIFTLSIFEISLKLYILANIGAFISFANLLCIGETRCALTFFAWIVLLIFAIYIYRYSKPKFRLYLWCVFIFLWLILGIYNPMMKV